MTFQVLYNLTGCLADSSMGCSDGKVTWGLTPLSKLPEEKTKRKSTKDPSDEKMELAS